MRPTYQIQPLKIVEPDIGEIHQDIQSICGISWIPLDVLCVCYMCHIWRIFFKIIVIVRNGRK